MFPRSHAPKPFIERILLASLLCLAFGSDARDLDDDMSEARNQLVEQIRGQVRMTASELGVTGLDPRVEEAMRKVPRHQFVPEKQRDLAYINHPLPIGSGQTISQPYIVAIMSQLLDVGPGDRVFELGTGSGYQAAVLAAMGVQVYTVEIVPELAEQAAQTLAALGYEGVQVRAGDGWLGWPQAAPFDGIIVTAAAPRIPQQLVDQLKPGGRFVIPIGGPHGVQQLELLTKDATGRLSRRNLLPVRFVPVTGPMEH